jgi:gamma-glutamyltranspeptidase/glutathione hydrolase
VPGTLAGFELAFTKYGSGKLKWRDLVEPARLAATDGYVLSNRVVELFKTYKETLTLYEDSRRIFLNKGEMFKEGRSASPARVGRNTGPHREERSK